MNVLSLFGGIETGLIALKELGIKIDNYYSSEIDKYASSVARFNHPEIIELGDITDYEKWNLPKIDLILAGFPCQSFSFAGNQLNFDDERGYLFFKAVEVLWMIQKVNPDVHFLFENVKMKKDYEKAISELMEVESFLIDSALVSAQDRKRLYWINFSIDQPENKKLFIRDILEKNGIDITERFFQKKEGTLAYKKSRSQVRKYWEKMRCLMAGPQSISNSGATNIFCIGGRYRALTVIECERGQTLQDNYTQTGINEKGELVKISNAQRYKMIGNGWTKDVVKHILKGLS